MYRQPPSSTRPAPLFPHATLFRSEWRGANPLAALSATLLRSGPRKADGQPVSLFEMAAHIVQMGQDGYHKAVTAMPQRQQQTSPEVEQLRAEMAQMKAEQTRNAVKIGRA